MLHPRQFWGSYTIWRAGSLHTASLSPSVALENLRSSKGITCIGVLRIQDQLPSLWDDQLSSKLTISSSVHNWSCFSKAQGLKTSQTIIISHSIIVSHSIIISLFREQKGCFFFSSTQGKYSLFLRYKLFPYLDNSRKQGSRKPGTDRGRVSSGFWLYNRMINDNSIRNKTKHPSCCQSNDAST